MKKHAVRLCVVAIATAFMVACAGRQHAAVQEIVLEISNQRASWVSASMTSDGASSTLGRVSPHDTRRWALPAQGYRVIHVTATDSAGAIVNVTDLDATKGPLLRWEIR